MSLFSWLLNRNSIRPLQGRMQHRAATPRFRPRLEALEDRALPSTYYAATTSDLIADINAANQAGGANTIVLTAPTTSPYILTAVNNTADGANGLPVIYGGSKKVAADNLTIIGNGDTIERSTATGGFRLFDVANGGSLSLQNVTLQNGYAWGFGVSAEGGAIYNQGTLVLSGVRIQNNSAIGAPGGFIVKNKLVLTGQDAAGGGIWSNGSLTVENQTLINGNSATGGAGGYDQIKQQYYPGGNAFGGGIYIAGGTANITGSTIGIYYPLGGYGVGNTAQGGNGYVAGSAYGGGVYVAAGTVTVSNDTLESNQALGGHELPNDVFTGAGIGYGGGLYVAGGSATLTNDYVDHNVAGTLYFVPIAEYALGYGGGIFIASGATDYRGPCTFARIRATPSLNQRRHSLIPRWMELPRVVESMEFQSDDYWFLSGALALSARHSQRSESGRMAPPCLPLWPPSPYSKR